MNQTDNDTPSPLKSSDRSTDKSENRIKVVYIAGCGRSGSTLLQNVLSQVEGLVAVGEVRAIWQRGFLMNKPCGCRAPFRECSFWRDVATDAYGDMDQFDAKRVYRLSGRFTIKDLPKVSLPFFSARIKETIREYLKPVSRLYRSISSVSGRRVIVDASKLPSFGYVLSRIDFIDLHVIHLIRDARAVAHSWSRKKRYYEGKDEEYMPRQSAWKTAMQWNMRNLYSDIYLKRAPIKYKRIRYEDFVAAPEESTKQLLDFVGERDRRLPFTEANRFEMTPYCSVFGNVARFQEGAGTIKGDEQWRSKMPTRDKALVTLLTWPLSLRYRRARRA